MVLADFSITVEFEVPREVRVVVYDSEKGLRIAASRFDNITKSRRRKQRGQFRDTLEKPSSYGMALAIWASRGARFGHSCWCIT
jgi:hypothetical protein